MKNKKNFLVFTGNRAEFGLVLPILEEMKKTKLNFSLVVSGAHLDNNFGNTLKGIKNLGYKNFFKAKINISANNKAYTPLSISEGIKKISKLILKINPDAMIIYADRFEGFAATIASTQMMIPTIHLEGGDITEGGVFDDNIRHAMTKLSHFHFTSNQEAKKRILLMGEEEWRVKNIGFTIEDHLKKKSFTNEIELIKKYKLIKNQKIIIFTLHPNPLDINSSINELKNCIKVLLKFPKCKIILTYPNNDKGSEKIIKILNNYKHKFDVIRSLGQRDYHGLLNLSLQNWHVVIMGNSSSGIKESPFFKCPTLDVGSRQQSRLRAKNVINAENNYKKIYLGLKKVLSIKFKNQIKTLDNPYKKKNPSINFINFLKTTDFKNPKVLNKKMTIKFK